MRKAQGMLKIAFYNRSFFNLNRFEKPKKCGCFFFLFFLHGFSIGNGQQGMLINKIQFTIMVFFKRSFIVLKIVVIFGILFHFLNCLIINNKKNIIIIESMIVPKILTLSKKFIFSVISTFVFLFISVIRLISFCRYKIESCH